MHCHPRTGRASRRTSQGATAAPATSSRSGSRSRSPAGSRPSSSTLPRRRRSSTPSATGGAERRFRVSGGIYSDEPGDPRLSCRPAHVRQCSYRFRPRYRPALKLTGMRAGALLLLALSLPTLAAGAVGNWQRGAVASSGPRRGSRRGRPGSDLHHRRVHERRRELDQRPGVQSAHEQLEPRGRPAAPGRPHDGSRLPRPGVRRGRLRAGPGTPDDALRIHG